MIQPEIEVALFIASRPKDFPAQILASSVATLRAYFTDAYQAKAVTTVTSSAPCERVCKMTSEFEKVLKKYLGLGVDDPIEKAVVTYPDQFYVLVDLRHFMRALGSPYVEFVERVEREAKERKANEKAYLSGAGVELGKEA